MEIDDSYSAITDVFVDFDADNDENDPDINNLSPEEIKEIALVVERDKTLRREERKRRKVIEESLDEKIIEIGLKNIDDGEKFCLNCGEKFKIFINPRRECSECLKGICNSCTYLIMNQERICNLCYLKASKDLKTGKWFALVSKENGRFRRNPTAVLVNSMRKLKAKVMITSPSPTPSNQHAVVMEISNGSIGSKHIPMYVRKEDSLKPIKKEKTKEAELIVRENAVDVVDSGIINNHMDSPSIEQKSKFNSGIHHLHPTNLENSKNLSASSNSIYSETYESYKSGLMVSGDVCFSVYYDDEKKTLNIYIDQCRNLAIADRSRRLSNPYIKTYLLPDKTKSSKKKSTHKNSNVNPIFKETLTYFVSKESLQSRTLSVAVWHKRLMTYNYFLGEVHILLADIDLSSRDSVWYPLMEKMKYPNRSGGHIYKGELIIKLKYKPSTRKDGKGSLHVLIVEAQQLESDVQPISAYVKGYLLPDRTNKTKKKTNIQKATGNIKWDSLLQFTDVTLEELKDRALELSIYHNRRLKSNEFLGGVRLNLGLGHVSWMDAQGIEKTTWENFLSNPNDYTEAILNLRPNLEY